MIGREIRIHLPINPLTLSSVCVPFSSHFDDAVKSLTEKDLEMHKRLTLTTKDGYLVTENSFVFAVQLEKVGRVRSVDDGLKLALQRTLPAHIVEKTAVEL